MLAAALAATLASCGPSSSLPTGDPTGWADAFRFPHAVHAETTCVECHDLGAVLAGRRAVPGADDHAPCDRDNCHRAEFVAAPGAFCTMCHSELDPTGAEPTTLAPYPPIVGGRALAAEFSHEVHVDYGKMEASVGFHVACSDCHTRDPEASDPQLPDHATCNRCHAAEAAPNGAPRMEECGRCHSARDRAQTRSRALIVGDLRFAHSSHAVDRKGTLIRCVACHVDVANVDKTATHTKPPTAACVECHDDGDRVPDEARMRVCEICHAARSESFGTLAPRSHLPASERPENHTLAFRSDHDTEARQSASQCAKCHSTMSGSPRDVCDECHQSMRPRNHNVAWREFDHGPEAATDSQPCATCHAAGFCISCHSRPPRSHFPLSEFSRGGHAIQASIDTRACVACHEPDRDCLTVGCHARGGM